MILALAGTVLAIVAIAVARRRLARRWLVVTVRGHSMSPTLRNGERLVVRRLAAGAAHACVPGDIVVFAVDAPRTVAIPGDPDHRVKRIAAVAGQPVPAWARAALDAGDDACVPPGRVVVSGDNPRSQDSRQLGYIPIDAIVAVVPHRPPPAALHAQSRAPHTGHAQEHT